MYRLVACSCCSGTALWPIEDLLVLDVLHTDKPFQLTVFELVTEVCFYPVHDGEHVLRLSIAHHYVHASGVQ